MVEKINESFILKKHVFFFENIENLIKKIKNYVQRVSQYAQKQYFVKFSP